MSSDPLAILRDVSIIIRQISGNVDIRENEMLLDQAAQFGDLLNKFNVQQYIDPANGKPLSVSTFEMLTDEMVQGKHVILLVDPNEEIIDQIHERRLELDWLFATGATVTIATMPMGNRPPNYIACLKPLPIQKLSALKTDLGHVEAMNESYAELVSGHQRIYSPNSPSYLHATQMQQNHSAYMNSLQMLIRCNNDDLATNIRCWPVTARR